ncbi:LysR family transcriptional regulator [Clostridioides difficile]|uniref:LysR family transcriptional regulator n=1 Tax=Clostridioides difficile TaxID=1496 RepID=UPI0009800CFE|nr:LysR family transcriptional regulator [Clostridioides difficile]MCV2272014.1 LysR family transcriptional regulator [Clostridioides difficile]MDV9709504.1 LysR family transcriptional regulator [Clostridioides difficile]SJO39312.1 HTH-type transcriptional regulator YofA [Clostridioides difficile]SJP52895.1 HTH-type transcriptional regulator YofA [Clostridioides difficile]HBF5908335.1 LysR family transcriptional regulator [Clostridioides difficile]
MESLDLRIFREVATEKSISKAAENLNYIQSNVTAHIKRLEEELNTVLFIRHGKGVTITDDGKKLLYYANAILDMLDNAAAEFHTESTGLRIGASQTLSVSRLPAWLSMYKSKYPNVTLSVKTDNQNSLLDALEKSELDCVFVQPIYLSEHYKTIFHFEEELRIVAPFGCKESDINEMPIVVNNLNTCPYRKMLMDWYFKKFVYLPKIVELDTVEAIIHSVALGMGISLLPVCVIERLADIVSFQIDGIDKMALTMVTLPNQQSNQVYQFADMAKALQSKSCQPDF